MSYIEEYRVRLITSRSTKKFTRTKKGMRIVVVVVVRVWSDPLAVITKTVFAWYSIEELRETSIS